MPLSPVSGQPLAASFVADLPPDLDAGEVTSLHVDHLGGPYLIADRTEAQTLSTWRLTASGEWASRAIPANGLRHPRVLPLPDDVWFAVGLASHTGPNARVLDASGNVRKEFRVGDGIQDLQGAGDGRVWVSYLDEGVYGGDVGTAGLLQFDLAGSITFSFWSLADQAPPIDDCYALNVLDDREQWLCYYSDFPVVQIVDGELGGIWENVAPRGASAFAVAQPYVLFGPGYERDDKLTLLDLSTGERSKHAVTTPEGKTKSLNNGRYCARGSRFFFCDDVLNRLFVVDLESLTFG